MTSSDPTTAPVSAKVLGWCGVVPFAALAIATARPDILPLPAGLDAGAALSAYGAAILAFMGGVQWGLTMRAEGRLSGWLGYAASVVPALLGWLALLLPTKIGLDLLTFGFAILLAYDLWTVRRGIAPPWYRPLRVALSVVVVLLLGVPSAVAS